MRTIVAARPRPAEVPLCLQDGLEVIGKALALLCGRGGHGGEPSATP